MRTPRASTLVLVRMVVCPRPPARERLRPSACDAIVHATVSIVARDGVAAVTHRRVALEAGVALSSTTWHFETKTDILVAALRWTARREVARIGAIADRLEERRRRRGLGRRARRLARRAGHGRARPGGRAVPPPDGVARPPRGAGRAPRVGGRTAGARRSRARPRAAARHAPDRGGARRPPPERDQRDQAGHRVVRPAVRRSSARCSASAPIQNFDGTRRHRTSESGH